MSEQIHKIFSEMAQNYDIVNKICSSGTMGIWRRETAKHALIGKEKYSVLDIGTGPGELAFEVYNIAKKSGRDADITGVDFSKNMIKVASANAKKKGIGIKFEVGDAMKLKYKKNSFDVVTSGFAIKNIDDPKVFAKEVYRVLKKGGSIAFVELTKPDSALERVVTEAYWKTVVRIGFAGNGWAYDSLKKSINDFDKAGFCRILKKAGFKNVKMTQLFSGAAFLITGYKT